MKKLLFSAVTLDVGGIETALVTLVNYLASQKENNEYKYEITLVLEKKQGLFLDVLDPNIKVVEYTPNNNKIVIIRKALNFLKQQHFKNQYGNRYDFSCSYATYSNPASFVARTASQNSALWVHSEYMTILKENKMEYIKFFDSIKANEFKKIIFVSKNAKNTFVNTFTNKSRIENFNNIQKFNWHKYANIEKKAEVIYNLIDYKKIIEKSKEEITDAQREEIYTFLNVGRHTEEDKKITRIIESARKLKEDGKKFRILLVGDGKETNNYKNMVKKYKLQDKIIFLGRKINPYPYYKIADSFLLTSEYEGFPVVYIESMILGLPIITTDVSDSKDVIENKFGIVVQKDTNSIYNAMLQAIDKGISCKEKFDYEKYNHNIEEQITSLIV